jgi:hypothetical protein
MPSPTTSVAYSKQNCLWPLRNAGKGWVRSTLVERFDSAVWHLVRTPRGSLLVDMLYGTDFEKLRTQGMPTTVMVEIVQGQISEGFSRYIPDLLLNFVQVDPDPSDDEHTIVSVSWAIQGAVQDQHGELAQPKTTAVNF